MKKFFGKALESMVLSVQMLVLLIVGILFIFAPNMAVGLGLGYMKFRTALSG